MFSLSELGAVVFGGLLFGAIAGVFSGGFTGATFGAMFPQNDVGSLKQRRMVGLIAGALTGIVGGAAFSETLTATIGGGLFGSAIGMINGFYIAKYSQSVFLDGPFGQRAIFGFIGGAVVGTIVGPVIGSSSFLISWLIATSLNLGIMPM